jgi:ubiquinone/menaquinone biosynthesis C-methylase UbiE
MQTNPIPAEPAPTESEDANLPMPHRCPFWVQYLLISPLRRLLEPAKKLLGAHIEPGMTVVEPGCGFGYFSLPMARMVGPEGRVISLDIEPRAIARLERRARRAGLSERVIARTCEPLDMGIDEYAGQVDRVVVMHTLHELDDLPGHLAQFRALLKPDGRLLVMEPRGHVSPEQFDAMMRCCEQAGFVELDPPDAGRKRLAALLAVAR